MFIRLNRIGRRRVIIGLSITFGAIACGAYPSSHDETATETVTEPLSTTSCQAKDVAVSKASQSKPAGTEGQGGTTYAIDIHGDVWGWGANRGPFFPLGHASTDSSGALGEQVLSPVKIGVSNATKLAAGRDGACALLGDGTVDCWGRPLGSGCSFNGAPHPYNPHLVPDVSDTLQNVVEITFGDNHACARKDDTTVWCWGDDKFGQLGDSADPDGGDVQQDTCTPVQMIGAAPNQNDSVMTGALQIAAAGSTTCVRRIAPTGVGEIDCMGDNSAGQLGQGGVGSSPHPVPTPITIPQGSNLNFVTLFGGGHGTFCVNTPKVSGTQKTFCWGFNQQGEATITSTSGTTSIFQIPTTDVDTRWAHGYLNGCEIKPLGDAGDPSSAVSCWGGSQYGVLPSIQSDAGVILAQTPIPEVANAFRMSVGETHACALTGTSLLCWGQNSDGEIGNGQTGDRAGVTHIPLSKAPPTCTGHLGNVGESCNKAVGNECGETITCGCSPTTKCDNATNTCQDDPTVCIPGCAGDQVCQNHVCKPACAVVPINDASVGTALPQTFQGIEVDSPATYGSNSCHAYIADITNASAFSDQMLYAGPRFDQTITQADCPNTRVTVSFYAHGDLLQTVGPVFGQWTVFPTISICTFGNQSSLGILAPTPNIPSGDLRIAALTETVSGGVPHELQQRMFLLSHCKDSVQDFDEIGVDCGGSCGACGGGGGGCAPGTHDCGDGKGCVSTACP